MRLSGKTVLVTAAGQGIGRASALAMAAEGAQVWATDLDPALLLSLEGRPGLHTATLDVLDKTAIEALVAGMPPPQVLFNCAGFVHHGSAMEATDADLDLAWRLNVRSQLWMIQAVLPGMLAARDGQGWGSIINMASVCGSVRGLPDRCVYGISKAAVIGLTKSVAADFVRRGIRCNAIAPGTVETPSLEQRIRAQPDPEEARRRFVERQPMGRIALPEEIAPVVVHLASDESIVTTGQVFSVDGGMTI